MTIKPEHFIKSEPSSRLLGWGVALIMSIAVLIATVSADIGNKKLKCLEENKQFIENKCE